jgi:hypothetical protein
MKREIIEIIDKPLTEKEIDYILSIYLLMLVTFPGEFIDE